MALTADQKRIANKVLSGLDKAAGQIEELAKSSKISPKVASSLVRELDAYADKLEVQFYGVDNLKARQSKFAKVIQRDSDEPYMDTFNNPQKVVLDGMPGEQPYLHGVDKTHNSKAIDTFDQDQSSSVSNRDEYAVRDLSDLAEDKKQPSWPRGSAGKSTRQGSEAKRWAP